MPAVISNNFDEDSVAEQYQFKVAILGAAGVGKTSILKRCVDNSYTTTYVPTMGVDFYTKQFVLPGRTQVTLQLWDVGGRAIGSKMTRNYIYGCQAALLVYDPGDLDTFKQLQAWLDLIKGACCSTGMPCLVLVANKSDQLADGSAVKAAQHNGFATTNGMYGYCLSALSGMGTVAAFYRLAADLTGKVQPVRFARNHYA